MQMMCKGKWLIGLAAWMIISLPGCGGGSNDGKSMLNPAMIGTWKLASVEAGTNKVTCPGKGPLGSGRTFECGANDMLNLKSDGTYDETLISTTDNSGDWFAIETHLMMDDELGVHNPITYTFELIGSRLILRTFAGSFLAEYERVGAPSSLTQEDILAATPDLAIENLVDPNVLGKWQYKSIEYNGTVIQCPGDAGIPGVKCGDNEWIDFMSNNEFTETVSSTSHETGFWYARLGMLYMDDFDVKDHDPYSSSYTIENDVMTMRMWGGLHITTLQRVQ